MKGGTGRDPDTVGGLWGDRHKWWKEERESWREGVELGPGDGGGIRGKVGKWGKRARR